MGQGIPGIFNLGMGHKKCLTTNSECRITSYGFYSSLDIFSLMCG
jgi:hypothetical protein